MKRGLLLLAFGVLILTGSLGWWLTNRPALEAGSAIPFEQPLTTATTAVPSPAPADLPRPAASTPTTTTSVPRFTVGEQARGHDRIPVALQIPAINAEAAIVLAGVERNGDMEVPRSVADVGWYKYGPAPGEPGSAVLAAHVDLASQGPGVFYDLRTLQPGDEIYVTFDDGTVEAYRAEARTIYEKSELPVEAIFSRGGPPVLTLITCGGGFNRDLESYDSNVVVYAVPLGDALKIN